MVSVIVPIYGVEQYLNACLDSIAAQSFSDLEVILVDDGSPDNCPAICDARAASDPRFRVIHRENGGLACARNTGLRLVTGDYVLFVDSDDLLPPDAVKSLLSALISTDADMARGTFLRFTETPPAVVIAAHQPPKLITPEEAVAALIAGNNAYIGNTVWRALYRRSVLWDGMFPDGRNFEDVSVSPRLFARCRKICLIPDTVYFYRKNRDSITATRSLKNGQDYLTAYRENDRLITEYFPAYRGDLKKDLVRRTYRRYLTSLLFYFRKKSRAWHWIPAEIRGDLLTYRADPVLRKDPSLFLCLHPRLGALIQFPLIFFKASVRVIAGKTF